MSSTPFAFKREKPVCLCGAELPIPNHAPDERVFLTTCVVCGVVLNAHFWTRQHPRTTMEILPAYFSTTLLDILATQVDESIFKDTPPTPEDH